MKMPRSAKLQMSDDFPGEKYQAVNGYEEMRFTNGFILFVVHEEDNVRHIYFKAKYVLEIETSRGEF